MRGGYASPIERSGRRVRDTLERRRRSYHRSGQGRLVTQKGVDDARSYLPYTEYSSVCETICFYFSNGDLKVDVRPQSIFISVSQHIIIIMIHVLL